MNASSCIIDNLIYKNIIENKPLELVIKRKDNNTDEILFFNEIYIEELFLYL